MRLSCALFCALWLFVIPHTDAHSWVEQLMVIAPNGSFIGSPGYPRGNVLRKNPSFSDTAMVWLLPPNGRAGGKILDTDAMCRESQKNSQQTEGSPALQAAPGSMVALRYQENGHVTLPETTPGKSPNRGNVSIYGTTQPSSSDTLRSIHKVWTADGSGGDKRGRLLATQSYDDGQCYQVNGGSISGQRQGEFKHPASPESGMDLWCQNDIVLPADAPKGKKYTLYWVWDWPTSAGGAGGQAKEETYTTCMDVDVTNADPPSGQVNFAKQDLAKAGVAKLMAQIVNPSAAPVPAASSSAAPSSFSSTSAPQPSAPAQSSCSCPSQAPQQATTTVYITLVPQTTTPPPGATGALQRAGKRSEGNDTMTLRTAGWRQGRRFAA
ncbi:MAG: hypothetical protein M1832_005685 [Thelocarpon impressellum]|nr:MAG: hypothetical protein M1832_005685 [Thelocarpon impressellum]